MKNNLTITVIFADSPTDFYQYDEAKLKLMQVYKTDHVLLLFGMGYNDFIITNKQKGTTYGRFKKHI